MSVASVPFEQEVVDFYRATDTFLKARVDEASATIDDAMIDYDVAPRSTPPSVIIGSIATAHAYCLDLLSRVPNREHPIVPANLAATETWLRAAHMGQRILLEPLTDSLLQVKARRVPDVVLGEAADNLDQLFKAKGMSLSADSAEQVEQQLVAQHSKEVTEAAYLWAGQEVPRQYGLQPIRLRPKIVHVDEPWRAQCHTDSDGNIQIKANTWHPAFVGYDYLTAAHEVTHYLQLGLIKRAIDFGALSVAAGIYCLHTPGNTQSEALAMVTEQLPFSKEPAWQHKFAAAQSMYENMIAHNAHLIANNPSGDAQKHNQTAKAYVREHMPYLPEAMLPSFDTRVEFGQKSPTLRAYLMSYYHGYETLAPVLSVSKEQRRERLYNAITEILLPNELQKVAHGI